MNFILSLLCNNDFPVLAQNVGMAGLTILIPVAIVIFSTNKEDFRDLDNHLILDHIVKAKWLLFYVALIFLPLFFWKGSLAILRFAELILWGIGLYYLIQILFRSYKWLKGNKFPMRLDFLKDVKSKNDMEESWSSFWSSDKINSVNEKDFFAVFSERIEKLLETVNIEDSKLIFKMMNDFKNYLNKRSDLFLSYSVLPSLLNWHIKIWKKENELLAQESKDRILWHQYYQLLTQLDNIFIDIETKVLNDRTQDAYSFFDCLEKHVEKYKEETVMIKKEDKRYYVEHLMNNFYRIFFDNVDDSPNKYHIWESYFPESWKIKISTVLDNVFQRIAYSEFIQWAGNRISNVKEKDYDRSLDGVSKELFPEVDPVWWSAILILALSPYDPNNRIKYVIEMAWTFGFGGRIRVLDGYSENDLEGENKMMMQIQLIDREEKKKTIEMIKVLMKIDPIFNHTFKKDNLVGLIEQANSLIDNYPSDSAQEKKIKRLLQIFNEISNDNFN